jgi:hypothetical protein
MRLQRLRLAVSALCVIPDLVRRTARSTWRSGTTSSFMAPACACGNARQADFRPPGACARRQWFRECSGNAQHGRKSTSSRPSLVIASICSDWTSIAARRRQSSAAPGTCRSCRCRTDGAAFLPDRPPQRHPRPNPQTLAQHLPRQRPKSATFHGAS